MLLCNARNNSQGFTQIETIIIVMIIAIISAIAAPSFLAMYNRAKVNNAVPKLQGAFQEAQREAIRKSKTCIVYVPDGAQVISDCFVTGDSTSTGLSGIPNGLPLKTLNGGVSIASNLTTTPKQIQFDFRGNTTTSGTFVLYMSDGSTQNKKCLVISNGLGLMRTGNYSGYTSTSNITASSCTTSQ